MNLYRVLVVAIAPKDSTTAIIGYRLASGDDEMFHFLVDDDQLDRVWLSDEEEEDNGFHNEAYLMENKGNYTGDYLESIWPDAYYGGNAYRWEIVKKDLTETEIELINKLGIIEPMKIMKDRLLMSDSAMDHFDYQDN